jgi:hypothetical protein
MLYNALAASQMPLQFRKATFGCGPCAMATGTAGRERQGAGSWGGAYSAMHSVTSRARMMR